MESGARPTIEDVARLAGVSTATVSRSLNEPARVRESTRVAVENAIANLGYTPNFGGRALRSNRTNTIGAVIPTMDNAIFARGLQALQETLAQAGVTLLVATSGYDLKREGEQVNTLLGRGVDGLLLIGQYRSAETRAIIERHRVPVVTAWAFSPDSTYPCVGFDNCNAAAAMAEHVMDQGHRRIAMIAGIAKDNDRATGRIAGVKKALKTRGLDLAKEDLIESKYDPRDAAEAAKILLERRNPPTAIICGNDVLAVGALMQARDAGLSVPGDVSIVGFDNIDLSEFVEPRITTVQVPHRRMGQAAAGLLLAMAYRGEEVSSVEYETGLIIRESLGPFKD